MTSLGDGRQLGHAFAQHFAAAEGQLKQVVRYVAEQRLDVNQREPKGLDTMLHRAARGGHSGVVAWLVAPRADGGGGANANLKNKDARAALHEAAWAGRVEVAEVLLRARADLTALDKARQTPLHRAAAAGHAQMCAALLDWRADGEVDIAPAATPRAGFVAHVDMKDVLGFTAAHLAAKQGHAAVLAILIERGADVNTATRQGSTPLHDAARSGSAEAVGTLLRAGADWDRKDHKGRVPQSQSSNAAVTRAFEKPEDVPEEAESGADAQKQEGGRPGSESMARARQQVVELGEPVQQLPIPEYRWEPRPAGAFGQARAAIVVALPACTSAADVALDVSDAGISLDVEGECALRAALPFAVDVEATRAKFSKKDRTMAVVVAQQI